jgi:type II secretory pathway component PulF
MKTLLSNGVNVLQALKIAEETCSNSLIAQALHTARQRVTDGTTISGPLAGSKVFPKMMTDMLSVGEQSGDMPSALGHIGRRYENEMDRNIKIFTNALEPILIVVIGGVVGFVAVGILMAVLKATSTISAGR